MGALQLYFLLLCSLLFIENENAEASDTYQKLVSRYQLAYNQADFSLLDSLTFTQKEYNDLVAYLEKQNPSCLTEFDKTFDVGVFKREFSKSHLSKLKTDSIIINKISGLNNCSNLEIKKISCFVYFKKQNLSVPVNLIVIDIDTQKTKILLDIINENYFENEKF